MQTEQQTPNASSPVRLSMEYLPCVNYAMMSSGVETCYKFVIENAGERDLNQVLITVRGTCIKEYTHHIDLLRSHQQLQVSGVEIRPDIAQLAQLTEALSTTFTLTISEGEGGVLFEQQYPIMLLAFDEWAGATVMPEQIAAFVVPNNPLLSGVKVKAARFLEQWTGSSQLDEYQTQDRNRVRAQVAAIYEALRSEGIVYSAPPASFEDTGQRIRLADKVLTEKLGTCLDTSLLVASCLESCGIFPLVVVLKGHAMVGAWLTPTMSPQMVCDDMSLLLKETADGNNNMVLLESTAITSSAAVSFEEAVKSARQKLGDESQFCFFTDIRRCRLGNIRPLPQRIKENGVWVFETDGVEHENATAQLNSLNHYDLRMEDSGQPLTKQMIWERKLLDFSLRNNLLNTRLGRRVVPFISFDIEHLEDHLQQGEDYSIMPSPGKKIEPNNEGMYDSERQAAEHQQYVSALIGEHKIASYLTEAELQSALKYIYRTARTSLEENGANSLFLTLGMLRWFETAKSEQPRYAPILLLPVDIVRKSGNNYVIRKRDEDIILNITLVELLKQNFRINLDVLKELPKDQNGVDVKQIFTYFRRAIAEQKKWNVIEESMLGLFSFNKFVMWNDIHANAHLLAENVVVAALIENRDKQQAPAEVVDARQIDRNNSPKDFSIPLDVDSSQMEAIVESGHGRTFILHGPPGTGKSQTITNMIANALYQGRRVLFVAEKMAALSVVQSRLEKVGLAPFCLELHSNKATKKHFLEQMDQVLNVTRIKSPAEYAAKADELYAERKSLISYMEALHRKGANGLSLYECINEYLSISEEEMDASTPLPKSHAIDAAYVAKCRGFVEQMEAILQLVGEPHQHPLYGLEPADNRLETTDALRQKITDFSQRHERYVQALQRLDGAVLLQLQPLNSNDMQWLQLFNDHLATEQQLDEQRQSLTSAYSQDVLRMNVQACRQEWETAKAKWFLPRYFAKKSFIKSMQRYGQVFEASVDGLLSQVETCQQTERLLKQQDSDLLIFTHDKGIAHEERQRAYESYAAAQPAARRQSFMRDAADVLAVWQQLSTITNQIGAKTHRQNNAADIASSASRWLAAYPQMKDWFLWTDLKHQMLEMEMQPVVSLIENGPQYEVTPRQAVNAFLKAIYRHLISLAIDQDAQLRTFNGMVFRQKIEQYKRDTLTFQELSKKELYSRLASRVPASSAASAEGSEISILKRNIANGGRGNSIRTIIDNIPTLLPRLCPCMLMSPISVAQYIDLKAPKFDLVIFDEASQMPTSEAVGAIARGKALIVVGDSKQMPPTSFFATTQVDEEEADIDDMESILDDCKTLSLREYYLSWHYRSKHESLIAFSNSQYYDNRLFTFPSVDDHLTKVRLVPVDGVYDKGHTRSNPEESKAIVSEVIRRLSDPVLQKYSIGIVAFSKVQGDRIEDDLTDELDRHPELKDLAYNAKEPIFVKNLENVQGDERDIILFSVGYGADKTGRVSMNFGPLNNTGGERRLNVAVSRARYEMIVYSTLRSSQIDLKRSQAKGVEGLKAFLEYAETGRLPLTAQHSSFTTNVVAGQICQMLTDHGYVAEQAVGRSNFKVDIAVATRQEPDKYLLGILCDGKTYFETKTTRDREIVQPNVLSMLNWHVMRVYSIDWYENRERTISQILDELKQIEVAQEAKKDQPNQEATPPHEAEAPQPAFVFDPGKLKKSDIITEAPRNQAMRPYVAAQPSVRPVDKAAYKPEAPYNATIIRQILQTEQPVCDNYLCKTMARLLGFGHAGANLQRAVALAATKFYSDPYTIGGVNTLWLNEQSAQNYTIYRSPSARAINEIPVREMMNAVKEVITEDFSLPKEKIPSLAARKLGFANAGTKISETINTVLDIMLREGVIKETAGLIQLAV